MKKKFIPGLLLLALTAGGFSTFTSCKDTDEDLYAELRGDQLTLKAELLDKLAKDIAAAKAEAIAEAKKMDDALKAALEAQIPSDDDIKDAADAAVSAWVTANGLDDLNGKITGIIQDMVDKGLIGGGGASCDCPLKDLTKEQATALIALANQAKAILGDNLDGNGGIFETVKTLGTNLKALDEVINGKDGKGGLVSQVKGLEEWFKDINLTPAEFQEYVKQGEWVKNHKVALQNIENKKEEIAILNKTALEALNQYYADLEGIDKMYTAIFKDTQLPEGETAWWNYAQVMQNIKNNSAAISALQDDVDAILGRLNDLVTSLILQTAANHIYGTFNTPFGINSMVLMANFGHLATQLESFPASNAKDMAAECYSDSNIDWSSITSDEYKFTSNILSNLVSNNQTSLGTLWFTVNPGTVNNLDKAGFELVNSRDEVSKVNLIDITKDDETLIKFGVNSNSRAAGNGNGLYRAEATVAPADLDAIKVNIEAGLAQALKDAVKNHTAADMAHMLKVIYNQLQNVCDANALRYTYEAVTGKNSEGYIKAMQKVYSNYGLAATAFKPLSFATLKGESFRHLPTISPIEIDKSMVDLDLGTFEVDSKNFALNLNFGKPEFTPVGNLVVTQHVTLTDQVTGNTVSGDIEIDITKEATEIQNNITGAIEEWLGTGENSLDARVEKSIWYALFNDKDAKDPKYPYDPSLPTGVVADLVAQVNEMTGNIQDKLDSLIDDINKDYLGKVNKLIEKYNSVAGRINKMLDDPNHYLQSVMFFRKADGNLGFLSTNSAQPSQFKGNGEAIELWATTYNFETVCPAFKKIVGVVKVTDQNGNENTALKNAANASMAKVLDGRVNRVALDVRGAKKGVYTYEIAYQALDYTGHTSTVKCYVQVIR